MTDMQTILRSFDSAHIEELTRRSRAIVKQELRQNAIAIRKIQQYDEMQRKGITVESYEKAKEKAEEYDHSHQMLETVWSGLWDAAKAIANPRLDEYVMNDREKEIIRNAIRENPKDRLTDAGWLLKNAAVFRDICDDTKAGRECGTGCCNHRLSLLWLPRQCHHHLRVLWRWRR